LASYSVSKAACEAKTPYAAVRIKHMPSAIFAFGICFYKINNHSQCLSIINQKYYKFLTSI